MSLWSGLGYYRRARMLHEAAQQIARTRGGVFPGTAAGLVAIRGVGRYTAGAVASIAFGERTPLVDGNVARVLARLFAVEDDVQRGPGLARVWEIADELVPARRAGDWNEALMELGATTCTPRAPRCDACPLRSSCVGRARGIEASLPRLRAKMKPLVECRVALVATVRRNHVLLRRRPDGLFGGLWEPPTVPATADDDDAIEAFIALLGVSLERVRFAGAITHTLSHRRLEARVLTATLSRSPTLAEHETYDALALLPPAGFDDLGMSTFARKVLTRAGTLAPVPVVPSRGKSL